MDEIECWFAFLPERMVRLQAFNQQNFTRTVAHIQRLAERLQHILAFSRFEIVEEPWIQLVPDDAGDGPRYCMVTADARYVEMLSQSDVETILGSKECRKCICVPSE